MSGSAVLTAHVIVAVLLLLGATVSAFVRAIRSRNAVVFTSGLAAVIGAGIAGAAFVDNQGSGASLVMALATAVAMFCYLAAVFRLRLT